ncbi:hypothetical protein J2T26_004699 [Citrobacter farmeri]|nr:hypothetical protein [Citrobacter farmeri]MCW2424938.1 hypothetical protein [Citrobacter farmeri]
MLHYDMIRYEIMYLKTLNRIFNTVDWPPESPYNQYHLNK